MSDDAAEKTFFDIHKQRVFLLGTCAITRILTLSPQGRTPHASFANVEFFNEHLMPLRSLQQNFQYFEFFVGVPSVTRALHSGVGVKVEVWL